MPFIGLPALAGWLAAHWRELALTALFLAVAYRERGAGHRWLGTQGARVLFWAVPVGAAVFALSPHDGPLMPVLAGAAAFIGLVAVPHAAGQNLAVPWQANLWAADNWPQDDRLFGILAPERLGYLAAAGIARMWLLSLPVLHGHPAATWLPAAGLWMPVAYLIGLKLPALPFRLSTRTEWGEFLTGAGTGVALVVALS